MSQPEPNRGSALVDFFASLRLTIFLLLALSVVSILGTVIPQGDVPHQYLHGLSETRLKLYQALDLFDMYHAWWFVGLLSLFTVNLVVCSVKRFPKAWRYVSSPDTVLDDARLQGLSQKLVLPLTGFRPGREQIENLLRAEKLPVTTVSETADALHLFSEKNSSSRLAVYLTHLSIVVIFIGSIVGSLFGYKGYVNIVEGEAVSSLQTKGGKTVEMGFSLRCDDFSVTNYPNGTPKEFKSILTVVGAGGEAVAGYDRVPVIVNDPLNYKGLTFYQSSYGRIEDHTFSVSDTGGGGVQQFVVPGQGAVRLPDGSTLRVAEATPDVSRFMPGKAGAAAQIEIQPAGGGQGITRVIYAEHPEENRANAPYLGGQVITYAGATGAREYTGLQVAKDPGVWIVWLGCTLMMLGIYGTFLMSHRRVWIRVTDTELVLAGHANKNQASFSMSFDRLADAVRKEIAKETR